MVNVVKCQHYCVCLRLFSKLFIKYRSSQTRPTAITTSNGAKNRTKMQIRLTRHRGTGGREEREAADWLGRRWEQGRANGADAGQASVGAKGQAETNPRAKVAN